jgi:hypothetical protein
MNHDDTINGIFSLSYGFCVIYFIAKPGMQNTSFDAISHGILAVKKVNLICSGRYHDYTLHVRIIL